MERAPRRWTDYGLAGLVVALGVAYWHWRLVLPVPLPQPVGRWNGDLYNIYVPIYHYAYRSSRWLPSWNPYQLAGTPFVANYNGGFFYPVSFLNAVVPVHLAIGYGSVLHLALAGVLAFACARALFLSPAAAMLAAAGFMFNDYFLLERIHPSYFAGFAWIPGVLLCAGRLATAPSAARGVLLGLVLAAQFLAGQAQIVCYEAYVLTLLAAAHGLLYPPSSPAHVRRLVTGAATAVAVALGVSAVQLVPTAEVVARAVRGFGGLSVAQTMPMTPSLAVLQGQAFASGPIALLAPLAFAGRARLAALAAVVVTFTGRSGRRLARVGGRGGGRGERHPRHAVPRHRRGSRAHATPGAARARRPLLARLARLGRRGGAGDRARRLSLPRRRGRPGRARGAVLVCSVERPGGARRDGRDRRPPDRGRPP